MRSMLLMNLAIVLSAAWRRRYTIVLPILILPFVGGFVGSVSPKNYESYTSVLVQEAARANPFLEDLTVSTNLEKRIAGINALLHSNHILNEVAFTFELVTMEDSDAKKQYEISKLSSALRAQLIGEDLVKISYKSSDPSKMAGILSLVSERFIDRLIAPERSAIFSSEEFLKRELEARHKVLTAAEEKLAAYRSRYADQLPNLHTNNAARLGELQDQLEETRRALSSARASRDNLQKQLSQTNPVVGKIEEAIVERLSDLALLRSRYTDQHSSVQSVLNQLESLQEERTNLIKAGAKVDTADLDRLWNMVSSQSYSSDQSQQTLLISQLQELQSANNKIQGLEDEIASLSREVDTLAQRVQGFGKHEQRLTELERDLTTNRKVYADLAERYEQAKLTGSLGNWEAQDRVKIIDPPFTPAAPTNMSTIMFVIAGIFGGIFLGCGLAVILELADTTVRYRKGAEQLLDVTVISRIPPIKPTAQLSQS